MDWVLYAMLGWLLTTAPDAVGSDTSTAAEVARPYHAAGRWLGWGLGPEYWQLGWRGDETEVLERRRWIVHTTRPRDRVRAIAARYGVTSQEVHRWNEEKIEAGLRPGTKLRVKAKLLPPPEVRVEHRVGLWESWPAIAAQYRVDSRDLRAWNRSVKSLQPGVVVQVWFDPGRPWTVFRRPATQVAPPTVSRGGVSVGRPHKGRLQHGVAVPTSDLYEVVFPRLAWGSTHAITHLVEAIADFRGRSGYEGTLEIASISREVGRRLPPHVSHQSGRDVDIRLPLLPTVPRTRRPNEAEIDWLATWGLVESLIATGEVRYVFLDLPLQRHLYAAARALGHRHEDLVRIIQWPYEYGEHVPIVRSSPGHDGHIHVRFKCGPEEPRCRNERPVLQRVAQTGQAAPATP